MRILLIAATLLACAPATVQPPRSAGPAPSPSAAEPVLVTLVTRDHKVAVRGGEGSPTFDVATREGKVLAERIRLDDLARTFPAVHRAYRSAYAGKDAVLDARLDERAEPAGLVGEPRWAR